jgi:hypothetical protein
VKTLRWIDTHSAQEIAAQMPSDFSAGGPQLYEQAINDSKSMFTVDGMMPEGGPEQVLEVLASFSPSVHGKKDTIDLSLLRRLRMSDRAVGHPDRSAGVVDAVPDASSAGDLELPLFEVDAVHAPGTERAPERMVPVIALAGIGRDLIPRSPRVRGRRGADLVPALHRIVRREAELPGTRSGRRGDAFFALGHDRSTDRARHEIAVGRDRATQPTRQLGIGVDLGGRAPLVDQLRERGEVVELGRGHDRPGELVDELNPIGLRQERSPRELIEQRLAEHKRRMNRQVPKRPTDERVGVRPLIVTVDQCQPECRRTPPTQEDVAIIEISHNGLGLTQQVGERVLDHTHEATLSELLQISSEQPMAIRPKPAHHRYREQLKGVVASLADRLPLRLNTLNPTSQLRWAQTP